MADADQVAGEQGDRGAPAPAGRPLLKGRLRVGEPPLLHDLLCQQHDIPVQEKEAGKAVFANEPELLVESLLNARGHGSVAAYGRLLAESPKVGLGGETVWQVGLGEGVAEVGGKVERAELCDLEGVGDCVGPVPEQLLHVGRGFQVQVAVGEYEGEGLVDGNVAPRGGERVLEPVALRCVVVDVVGCDHRGARLVCQGRKAAVARRIAPKEVALELDVHGARAEPLHVAS